jgi:hypothetical protein
MASAVAVGGVISAGCLFMTTTDYLSARTYYNEMSSEDKRRLGKPKYSTFLRNTFEIIIIPIFYGRNSSRAIRADAGDLYHQYKIAAKKNRTLL